MSEDHFYHDLNRLITKFQILERIKLSIQFHFHPESHLCKSVYFSNLLFKDFFYYMIDKTKRIFMKRTHLKQLFHILFYILLLCVLKGFVNNSGELNLTYFSGTKCNPINESYQQFQVEINGIKYPKHVSLHLNKSIDFRSSPTDSIQIIRIASNFNNFMNIVTIQ